MLHGRFPFPCIKNLFQRMFDNLASRTRQKAFCKGVCFHLVHIFDTSELAQAFEHSRSSISDVLRCVAVASLSIASWQRIVEWIMTSNTFLMIAAARCPTSRLHLIYSSSCWVRSQSPCSEVKMALGLAWSAVVRPRTCYTILFA